MALDSEEKRRAAVTPGMPGRPESAPKPDGGLDAGDRAQMAGMTRVGIAGGPGEVSEWLIRARRRGRR